jgi:transformation/transcription domain-associated protein
MLQNSTADGEEGNQRLARSLYSFKVLKECPIILVLLLQIHRKFLNETVGDLVPLIVEVRTALITSSWDTN